jgi:hypothetical protein
MSRFSRPGGNSGKPSVRIQSEHQRCNARNPECEGEDTEIRLDVDRDRALTLTQQRRDIERGPACGSKADQAATDRNKCTLGDQLPYNAPSAGAHGHAHGRLAGPCGTAREKQVRDVHARDRQDDGNNSRQDAQRRLVLAAEPIDAAVGWYDSCGQEKASIACPPVADPGPRHMLAEGAMHHGLRRRRRDAAPETCHERHPRPAVDRHDEIGLVLHAYRQRQRDLDRAARLQAFEAGRGDADDSHRVSPDDEPRAERVEAATVSPLPVPVTDHGNGAAAGREVWKLGVGS